MDKSKSVKTILSTYKEITIEKAISETIILFKLFDVKFLLVAPSTESPSGQVLICTYDDEGINYPHIMLKEWKCNGDANIPKGEYRYVCLYEQGTVVNWLIPFEAKVTDAINRLIKLLTLSRYDQMKEFQKEFMFYWNSLADKNMHIHVYIKNSDRCTPLDVYGHNKIIRLIEPGLYLSDIVLRNKKERRWEPHSEYLAIYIPITDSRDLLPPHKRYKWDKSKVLNIVDGKQIQKISKESYKLLKSTATNTNNIILVFGLSMNNYNNTFAVKITCTNGNSKVLIERLRNDISKVEVLYTERRDYMFMCENIGNHQSLCPQHILLVGAGSLGSYIGTELVKNGTKEVITYDGDSLYTENSLRWAWGSLGCGLKKASALSQLLKTIHPEVKCTAHDIFLEEKRLELELKNADLVVFAVDNSDIQLRLNRLLKKLGCKIPVLYVWIEAGGVNSHILAINDYSQKGCFECLYTNEVGQVVNNRASRNDESMDVQGMIGNSCGGTRAAYGTAVLLRTTAAVLEVVEKIWSKAITKNTLFDITSDAVIVSDRILESGGCRCCGEIVS